jgi:hypothetical protein
MKAWEATLRPFANRLAALDREIDDAVKKASRAKLVRMVEACRRATTSNCWWATFQVRDMVSSAAAREIRNRDRAKGE